MRSAISKPSALRWSLSSADQLARDALGAELVVEGGVERDRVAAVLRERELLVRRGADLDVVGPERDGRAVDEREVVAAVGVERAAAPSAPSTVASASFTSGIGLPTRGPSARKLGTTV